MPPAPAPTRSCNLFSNLTALPYNIFAREVSVKDISYHSDTKRAIDISLGILFGIAAPILILVTVYCVYKRRNQSQNQHLPSRPGVGNGSDSVMAVPGAEKVPSPLTTHHPDSRDKHMDRDGFCALFCIECCGLTRERSEGQMERRRRQHSGRTKRIVAYDSGGGEGGGGSVGGRMHEQPRYQSSSTYIMEASTDERISRVPHRRETPDRRRRSKDHRRPASSQSSSLEAELSAKKADKKGNHTKQSEAVQFQLVGIPAAPRPCMPRRQRTHSPPGGVSVHIQQNPQGPDRLQIPNKNPGRRKPSRRSPLSRPPSQGSTRISYPNRIYDPRRNQSSASISRLRREEACGHDGKGRDGEERVYIRFSSSNDSDHGLVPPLGYPGFSTNLSSSSSIRPSGSALTPSFIHINPPDMSNTVSSGRNKDPANGASTTDGRDDPMSNDYIGNDGEEDQQVTLEHPELLVDFSRRSQEDPSDIVIETVGWTFAETVCGYPISGADSSNSSSSSATGTDSPSKETWNTNNNIPISYAEPRSEKPSSGLDSSDPDWSRINPNNTSSVSPIVHSWQPVTVSHSPMPSSSPSASDAQSYSSAASALTSGQSFSSTGYFAPGSTSHQSSTETLIARYEYFLAPTYSRPSQSENSGIFFAPSSPDYSVITATPSPSVISDSGETVRARHAPLSSQYHGDAIPSSRALLPSYPPASGLGNGDVGATHAIRELSSKPSESVSAISSRRQTNFVTAPSPVYCDTTSNPTCNSNNQAYAAPLISTIIQPGSLAGGPRPTSRPPSCETRENSDNYVPMPQITVTQETRVYAAPPRVAALPRRQDLGVTRRQEVEEGVVGATDNTGDEELSSLGGEGMPVPVVSSEKSRYHATVESVIDDSDGMGGVGFV